MIFRPTLSLFCALDPVTWDGVLGKVPTKPEDKSLKKFVPTGFDELTWWLLLVIVILLKPQTCIFPSLRD